MEHIYAVRTSDELAEYQKFVKQIQPRLMTYIDFLKREYAASKFPNTIVWTSQDNAARLISDMPIPAYTNDFRVVITPNISKYIKTQVRKTFVR